LLSQDISIVSFPVAREVENRVMDSMDQFDKSPLLNPDRGNSLEEVCAHKAFF
jgi:hypothetical protein